MYLAGCPATQAASRQAETGLTHSCTGWWHCSRLVFVISVFFLALVDIVGEGLEVLPPHIPEKPLGDHSTPGGWTNMSQHREEEGLRDVLNRRAADDTIAERLRRILIEERELLDRLAAD